MFGLNVTLSYIIVYFTWNCYDLIEMNNMDMWSCLNRAAFLIIFRLYGMNNFISKLDIAPKTCSHMYIIAYVVHMYIQYTDIHIMYIHILFGMFKNF